MSAGKRRVYAVDLNGTLAYYDRNDPRWDDPTFIGDPVPAMLARVCRWLAQGHQVVVFTARPDTIDVDDAIKKWCRFHFGEELQIAREKKKYFSEIWDDKARRVEINTGREM